MNKTKIEVRIKWKNNKRRIWEKITPFGIFETEDLDNVIDVLTKGDNVYEVRWNYIGSPQGYFVFGKYAHL